MPKKPIDPFREEKTPAHDVMQLYLKAHLDGVVFEFLENYSSDKIKVESGIIQSKSTITSEKSIQEPYKKHIVVDGLITICLVHSNINLWRNNLVEKDGNPVLYNYCSDHIDKCHFIPLKKYESIWGPVVNRIKRTIEKYEITARDAHAAYWNSRSLPSESERRRYLALEKECVAKAESLKSKIPYIIRKLVWAPICTEQNYLQSHTLECGRLLVELKPKILSYGDVLRQIHEYDSICEIDFLPLLITPDRRFDLDFKSENVAVLHFEKKRLLDFALERNIPLREYDFDSIPPEKPRLDQREDAQKQLDLGGK